jgi:hypothetical protein
MTVGEMEATNHTPALGMAFSGLLLIKKNH